VHESQVAKRRVGDDAGDGLAEADRKCLLELDFQLQAHSQRHLRFVDQADLKKLQAAERLRNVDPMPPRASQREQAQDRKRRQAQHDMAGAVLQRIANLRTYHVRL
jgi:hypothetical protein